MANRPTVEAAKDGDRIVQPQCVPTAASVGELLDAMDCGDLSRAVCLTRQLVGLAENLAKPDTKGMLRDVAKC
jgi:hypothetical protein